MRLTPADRYAVAQSLLTGIRAAGADVYRCPLATCHYRVHVRGQLVMTNRALLCELTPELLALLSAEQGLRN